MGYIFRKIGGRVIRIKIGSVSEPLHTPGVVGRKITATLPDKTQIARMHMIVPKKGKHVDVSMVAVEKKFQGHGISRALFKHAQKLFGKIGKKFIRGNELQHVAQVKIRSSVRGPRGKRGSKFIADGFGPYAEKSKKVRASEAIAIIKKNYTPSSQGQSVKVTTMIPKKYRFKGRKKK